MDGVYSMKRWRWFDDIAPLLENFAKLYVVWVWVLVLVFSFFHLLRLSLFLSLSLALSPSNKNSICLTPPPFLTLSLTLRVSLPLCLRWMPFLFLVACVLCCLSVYYFDYYVFCVWMFRMNVCVLFARASFIEAPRISLTEICYWCAFPHTQQPKTHIKSG